MIYGSDFVGKKGTFTIINPYDPDFFILQFWQKKGIFIDFFV